MFRFQTCNARRALSVELRLTLLETKPSFTAPLKGITITEDESVTLECELSKPDQKVKWFKNGKEIKPDKKRGILSKTDGRKHSLIIPKTEMGDAAEYSVKCGEEETEAKLIVEGRITMYHGKKIS